MRYTMQLFIVQSVSYLKSSQKVRVWWR